eukprot:scaffold246019_cov27-Tisochrysis_lutea.AAC.1
MGKRKARADAPVDAETYDVDFIVSRKLFREIPLIHLHIYISTSTSHINHSVAGLNHRESLCLLLGGRLALLLCVHGQDVLA